MQISNFLWYKFNQKITSFLNYLNLKLLKISISCEFHKKYNVVQEFNNFFEITETY